MADFSFPWVSFHSQERGLESFSREEWKAIQKTETRYLYMPKHSGVALTLHRWNGPAIRYADGEEHWYVNGRHVASYFPCLDKWVSYLN